MLNFYSLWALFMIVAMILIHPSCAQTATTTCTAEANFQGCKKIQETKLGTCPPADYACMCTAHKLIQECYNLCPSYAAEASSHDGTVKSICNAVPSSSSAVALATASSLPPTMAHSPTPSASPSQQVQQNNQQHSGASLVVPPSMILVFLAAGSLFICVVTI